MANAIGKDTAKIAAAVAAGYLIGRTKNGKLVLMLACGVVLAGRALAQMGLDQSKLRGVLVEVLSDVQRSGGKALTARAERFSDSLRSRTDVMGGLGLDQDEAMDDEEEEGEADEEEPAEKAPASSRSNGQASDGDGRDSGRSSRSGRSSGGTGRRVRQAQTAARGGR